MTTVTDYLSTALIRASPRASRSVPDRCGRRRVAVVPRSLS